MHARYSHSLRSSNDQHDCHAKLLFADTGLLPISSVMCAAKLRWKSTLCSMSADRFPLAADLLSTARPLRLAELARVIALCAVSPMWKQLVS